MNRIYYILLAMLALVLLLIAADWLLRWLRDRREEREMEENNRRSRADGLTGRTLRRFHEGKKRDGAVDNDLVCFLGLWAFVGGTAFVLCALLVMWAVLFKQWLLGAGNRRRLRFSSRHMGRAGCPINPGVGRADCGPTPEKARVLNGADRTAGSESLN